MSRRGLVELEGSTGSEGVGASSSCGSSGGGCDVGIEVESGDGSVGDPGSVCAPSSCVDSVVGSRANSGSSPGVEARFEAKSRSGFGPGSTRGDLRSIRSLIEVVGFSVKILPNLISWL